jgi:hypothetical protein
MINYEFSESFGVDWACSSFHTCNTASFKSQKAEDSGVFLFTISKRASKDKDTQAENEAVIASYS